MIAQSNEREGMSEKLNSFYSPFNWFQDWIGKRPSGWTKADFNECMKEFINEFFARTPPKKVTEALKEVREYFRQRADAEYAPEKPAPAGNEEMRLLTIVEQAINHVNGEGHQDTPPDAMMEGK